MKESKKTLASRIFALRQYLLDHVPYKIIFLVTGLLATIWFLIRVIPKPTRAGYPCMQAAAPLMSGFVLYILSFTGTFFAFRKANAMARKKSYITAVAFTSAGLVLASAFFVTNNLSNSTVAGNYETADPIDGPNNPMGTAQGVMPGRVVWAWNPNATEEDISLVPGDAWWDFHNNDTMVIRNMVHKSLLLLTGKDTHEEVWESIFANHNLKKHGEARGYEDGEIVFVKVNQGTASWLVNTMPEFGWPTSGGLDAINPSWKRNNFGAAETGPFVVLNLLRQLVNVAGVPEENIYVGDPMSIIFKHNFDVWFEEFPDVKYIDKRTESHNRTFIFPAAEPSMTYSDQGDVLGQPTEKLFEEMEMADYMINVAGFKPHKRGGVTFTAKNHFGSITSDGAGHLHPALISTSNEGGNPDNAGYNKYRVLVDLMGHKYLGRNTMLYVLDGFFGGCEEETKRPIKYFSEPFDGDWTNSVFMSLDQVALESVAYDFMRNEFDGENNPGLDGGYPDFPNWVGVDDYLHQAADNTNWPEGITYNPDGSGPLPSLGVHEHWNNPQDKLYSRNLGTGNGIELVQTDGFTSTVSVNNLTAHPTAELRAYPNPFRNQLTLSFNLEKADNISVNLFDLQGRMVANIEQSFYTQGSHEINWNAARMNLTPGFYMVQLRSTSSNTLILNKKVQLINQ